MVQTADGSRLGRGADRAKDQSYVLHMLEQPVLDRLILPLGTMTKNFTKSMAQPTTTASNPNNLPKQSGFVLNG